MASESVGVDERAFQFLCGVIRFVRTIRPQPGIWRLADQLVASSGSIAANREEASIALRSAKESVLWLRGCHATQLGDRAACDLLLREGREIARILAAIVIKSKSRPE